MATVNIESASRAKRLREATHETHEALDRRIMAAASFADIAGYGRFAEAQYLFHRDIDALYDEAVLGDLLPDLAARRRLPLIVADLGDLGLVLPDAGEPVFRPGIAPDVPTALGWLYVAEGSNLGAAILRKEAARLGLSDARGARHLAPGPQGPAAHWRVFTAALDAAALTADEEVRVITGAEAAFARVRRHVEARLG
jgi:heme oxygenase